MIREPFHIIRENFVELAGGQMKSGKDRSFIIETITDKPPQNFQIKETYIIKTGSLILVLLYISGDNLEQEFIKQYKSELEKTLGNTYKNSTVEILID